MHKHSLSTNRSMSDTESQLDSFHSPLRFDSPLRSDEPDPPPQPNPSSKALVPVDKFYSPLRSPLKPPEFPARYPTPSKFQTQAPPAEMRTIGGENGVVGGERRSRGDRVVRRDVGVVNRAALGFRVCEMALCLISFSVMAADKTQGWSGDSFDRYKEYRFCVAVTVIGFVYSGFQACNLAYHLLTGEFVFSHHLRFHFDFAMDQILAYLLLSASSSAASRVVDWVSNWGNDEFTVMASASIAMSFLAFMAFALSSLISGYNLCNSNST